MTSATKNWTCFKCGKSYRIQNAKTGAYENTWGSFPLPSMASKHVRGLKMAHAIKFGVEIRKGENSTNIIRQNKTGD